MKKYYPVSSSYANRNLSCHTDDRVRIWQLQDEFINQTVQAGGAGLMVWGFLPHFGTVHTKQLSLKCRSLFRYCWWPRASLHGYNLLIFYRPLLLKLVLSTWQKVQYATVTFPVPIVPARITLPCNITGDLGHKCTPKKSEEIAYRNVNMEQHLKVIIMFPVSCGIHAMSNWG